MSVKVMSLVWYCTITNPQEKSVLLALADRANEAGYCWPGLENIVIKTALSKSTVKKARKGLIEAGWIISKERFDKGRCISNIYKINIHKLEMSQLVVEETAEDKKLSQLFSEETPEKERVPSSPPPFVGGRHTPGGGGATRPPGGAPHAPNTSVDTSVDTKKPSVSFTPQAASKKNSAEVELFSPQPEKQKTQRRGSRIPDHFVVTAEMVAWAVKETPNVDGRSETAKFIDYWKAKSGKDAVKADWTATWRNWMRNARDRIEASRSNPGCRSGVGDTQAWLRRSMDRAVALDAAAAAGIPVGIWE